MPETRTPNACPQRTARRGTSAIVPGVSVHGVSNGRGSWQGWAVRASIQVAPHRQRVRSWVVGARPLSTALLEACRWRARYSGDDPAALYARAWRAVPDDLMREIGDWDQGERRMRPDPRPASAREEPQAPLPSH